MVSALFLKKKKKKKSNLASLKAVLSPVLIQLSHELHFCPRQVPTPAWLPRASQSAFPVRIPIAAPPYWLFEDFGTMETEDASCCQMACRVLGCCAVLVMVLLQQG